VHFAVLRRNGRTVYRIVVGLQHLSVCYKHDDMMYSSIFEQSMARSHTAQIHLVNVFCRAGSNNFLNI
jgi:hypothetical protein